MIPFIEKIYNEYMTQPTVLRSRKSSVQISDEEQSLASSGKAEPRIAKQIIAQQSILTNN